MFHVIPVVTSQPSGWGVDLRFWKRGNQLSRALKPPKFGMLTPKIAHIWKEITLFQGPSFWVYISRFDVYGVSMYPLAFEKWHVFLTICLVLLSWCIHPCKWESFVEKRGWWLWVPWCMSHTFLAIIGRQVLLSVSSRISEVTLRLEITSQGKTGTWLFLGYFCSGMEYYAGFCKGTIS